MNKFKIYLILSIPLLSYTTTVFAQPADPQELQTVVQDIGQLAADLSNGISNALECIDVDASNLTPLIRESESLAQEITQLDWQRLLEQQDAMAHLIYQKEKVTEYAYPINSRQSVNIDNRYGKITINNWAKNEIKVIITVRTAENSERRAQEALDHVRIDQSRSSNVISFKTAIESGDSNWWSMLTSGGGDRTLRVDYDVYLPKKNELALANRYGAIELSDRDGTVNVSVSYGSLQAGRLNGPNNSLSVAYSKADVEYLNEGEVSVRYGGFTLSEAEKLTLAMSSSGGKIGKINQETNISLRYSGGFEMGLGPSIQKASVAAAYSNIHIRPARDAAFNFDVAVSYGGFDYDRNHINIGSKSESHTSASYSGYWNKAVDNMVSVNARYGAVSLK
ncbi:MAG TPA: hypothetical protein VNQ80_13850 [Parapedobacter sp.]|uniref:hypothetical protein n=1 Tax=Parapedobacter sp. TaxID=1958893 RepID=UPI002B542DDD|nr:hypothetical protein [Parapedobacter sp.]HWK58423.1 hypothetical protein [Parapedobacter sp.]